MTNGLVCHYCLRDGKGERAFVTIHDGRGCLHVCWKHAQWRQTMCVVGGHSKDCPFRTAKVEPDEPCVAKHTKCDLWIVQRTGSAARWGDRAEAISMTRREWEAVLSDAAPVLFERCAEFMDKP